MINVPTQRKQRIGIKFKCMTFPLNFQESEIICFTTITLKLIINYQHKTEEDGGDDDK